MEENVLHDFTHCSRIFPFNNDSGLQGCFEKLSFSKLKTHKNINSENIRQDILEKPEKLLPNNKNNNK